MKQSYLEKILEKAQNTWGETLSNITPLPDVSSDGFYIYITSKDLHKLLKERHKLAWADGVCQTIACMDTDEKNRNKRREDFCI